MGWVWKLREWGKYRMNLIYYFVHRRDGGAISEVGNPRGGIDLEEIDPSLDPWRANHVVSWLVA